MKKILAVFLLSFSSLFFFGQENPDFENLVKLGELYSKNINKMSDDVKMELEKLRTPGLDHIIDALIAISNGDVILITKKFLSKPSLQEMKYWYVLREILYNNVKKDPEPKPNEEVARETLEKEIDPRWLLDNYYYRICIGLGQIFNDKDLSSFNITFDDYGLENETEKAILFFNISDPLLVRFKVLQMVKNYDKILDFVNKLPTFNGESYYEYTSFDFEDFDWIGYDKTESYKERHLGNFYAALNGHFSALAFREKTEEMRTVYFNSVLFIPDYFKYSGEMLKDLKALYKKSKK